MIHQKDITVSDCFKALGLQHNASFSQARKAFKIQAQRLHPDRYPTDERRRNIAEAKFLHLNKCFQILKEHYRVYGDLPSIDRESTSTYTYSENQNSTEALRDQEFEFEAERITQGDGVIGQQRPRTDRVHSNSSTQTLSKSSHLPEICVALVIVAALGYFFFGPQSQDQPSTADDEHLEAAMPQAVGNNAYAARAIALTESQFESQADAERAWRASLASRKYQTESSEDARSEIPGDVWARALLSARQPQTLTLFPELKPLTPAQEQRQHLFSVGSSYAEVINIHGVPDRADQSTWYFDTSTIEFQDGRVISWQSHPEHPLATIGLTPRN